MIPSLRVIRFGYQARANLVRGASYVMLALLILVSWTPAQAASSPVVLVKSGFSSIGPLVNARGTFFFTADYQGTSGLWTSDGTAAGTQIIGRGGIESVKMRGKLYYTSYDSAHGWELWRSDGTAEGTALLKDIYPGSGSAFPYIFDDTVWGSFLGPIVNGYLFFAADDGVHGLELWRTDGTTVGTTLVSDLTEGSAGSELYGLSSAKGLLFFVGEEDNHFRLWRSDGTNAGTFPLTPIASSCFGLYDLMLPDNGQTVFFSNSGAAQGCGLWASDGTPAGTRLLKEIPDVEDLFSYGPETAILHGNLYFAVGHALWRSDGTPEGTLAIKSLAADIGHVVDANGTLFFLDSDPGGAVLWRSDGTPAGTRRVSRLLTGVAGDQRSCFTGFTSHNGLVFFNSVAEGGESGCELWRSDGTEAGTVMVKDLIPGPAGAYPMKLTNVNGLLVFLTSGTNILPTGLAKSDGTLGGTVLIQHFMVADFTVVRSLMFISTYNDGRMDLWAVPLSALGIKFAYLPSIHQ